QHALLRAMTLAPGRFEDEAAHRRGGGFEASDPVTAQVEPQRVDLSTGSAAITVTLIIDPAYHLSAGEPGEAGLIPTRLELRGGDGLSLEVEYPEGRRRTFPFADQPLSVYEGRMELKATLRRSTDGGRGAVNP